MFANFFETERIHWHLLGAELQLRWKDSLHPKRARLMRILAEYRRARAYPDNSDAQRPKQSQLVGANGNLCAVGAMLAGDGRADLALRLAGERNCARILEIEDAEFSDWARSSGFRKGELERIQPTYHHMVEYSCVWEMSLFARALGFLLISNLILWGLWWLGAFREGKARAARFYGGLLSAALLAYLLPSKSWSYHKKINMMARPNSQTWSGEVRCEPKSRRGRERAR